MKQGDTHLMSITRRTVLASAVSMLAAPALAESWPSQPLRLVVPYAPGGATDSSARLIGERLSAALGQPVVIENKAGGATQIGMDFVAKSKPDGYTLVVAPAAIAASVALGLKMPYDPQKDLVAIAQITDVPVLFIGNIDQPFKNFPEFVAWAKVQDKPVPYGSSGPGSIPHLWGELMRGQMGLRMEHLGYKGSADGLKDVLGGHIPVMSDALLPSGAQIVAGKVRGLVVASHQRVPMIPDVPTPSEVGLKDAEFAAFFGVMAPAGTPPEIVARLNREINLALEQPALAKKITDLGMVVTGGTPEAFAERIRRETERMRRIVVANNIKVSE